MIIAILLSIIFSAFFSGMEIAFVSANKLRLEIDKKQTGINAQIITVFANHPSQFISTMLVGNNLALVFYGILMARLLEPILHRITPSDFYILLLQTLISTLIILFTAEFLPKALFRIVSNSVLKFFALPLVIFYYLFYPIVRFSISLSTLLIRIFTGVKIDNNIQEKAFNKLDINHTINEYNAEEIGSDNLLGNDIKIFQNALDFSGIKLRECMVPRTELVAMPNDVSIDDLRKIFIDTGFSRILIYRETVDEIIGFVNILSVFKNSKNVRNAVVPIIYAPETMPANKLLEQFIQEHKSMAVVVDEFGGTAGIVTIEDIMEEIFGEIEDEHDVSELIEKQISKTEYIFSGRMEVDYINEHYNLGISESEDYETIAGYILFHHGDFPEKNQEILIKDKDTNFLIKILRLSETRIDLLQLYIK